MPDGPPILHAPPRRRRRPLVSIDPEAEREAMLRRRGFWAGWGGVLTSLLMGGVVVALLVGWVLLWADRLTGGGAIALLVVGCCGFALLLLFLATLQSRLRAHWRLRQAEAAFLTGVSHGLRTPISAIRAAAQVLERQTVEPAQRERLLLSIIHQTRRLALRVDNVLEMGRIEVERGAFADERQDLTALAHAAADEARPIIESRSGGIDVEASGPLPVRADPRALRLLLDNLLDNAMKYADGPPLVRVELGAREGFAVLRIIDAGHGFDPARTDHIFKRFRRGDAGGGGAGLGLPLSRAIARGHGGDLYLFSEGKGTGAQAEVWLPVAPAVGERW